MMKKMHPIALALTVLTIMVAAMVGLYLQPELKSAHADNPTVVNVWLTTRDQTKLLAQQNSQAFASGNSSLSNTITIDENKTYQQMVGFGASLTDSSASLIFKSTQRDALMHRLFDTYPADPTAIGLSFLRQPMGASDFTTVGDYSYDDPPPGQTTDPTLSNFNLGQDTQYIIPLLHQAFQNNTQLQIMATPWSPPGWMKLSPPDPTHPMRGGTLDPNNYKAYANYFVKFIQTYQDYSAKKLSLPPIYAITPQNEPQNSVANLPSMSMPAADEDNFIKNYLAPAFASNGIPTTGDNSTKIIAYDHNWDTPTYPEYILNNSSAAAYVQGSAYHCYAGDPSAQSSVHDYHPTTTNPTIANDIYFTECTGHGPTKDICPSQAQNASSFGGDLGWGMERDIIGATRNWAKTVTLWNMALDQNCGPINATKPYSQNERGVVTIDSNTGNITYNAEYYMLGHISKFVVPRAYRIDSNSSGIGSGGLEDVAFKNPDGSKALIVYNSASPGTLPTTFAVNWNGQSFTYDKQLPAGAVATFTWSQPASNLAVTSGISAPSTTMLHQSFTASYTVTNTGTIPFTFTSLYIAMRGPNGENVDLGGDNMGGAPITLSPGDHRDISITSNLAGGCSSCGTGTYTLFASVLLTDNSWWNPPAANGAVNRVPIQVVGS